MAKTKSKGFTTFSLLQTGLHSCSLHKRGFTLVELLVVIVIIAVLAVVGAVIFTSVKDAVNDARMKADINALAKAYEVKYDGVYHPVEGADFADGVVPTAPDGSSYTPSFNENLDGFQICATLSGGSSYCGTSVQGQYVEPSPTPTPTPVTTPTPTPTPIPTYDLKAYYPNTDMYINYYLEGYNYISGSPVRSVLWFEPEDQYTYKMYNWGPEDPNGRCHYDQLSWWADGFLRYVKTVDSCPSSTPNEVVYSPPIIFLPRYWNESVSWSLPGSSHTDYYENEILTCTGTNDYTASIIGIEEVTPGIWGIHWRTRQTTTWDDFGTCIDWLPTQWQEDYWLIDQLPIIGGGSAKGLKRSVGGNLDGSDRWDIWFDSWKALP